MGRNKTVLEELTDAASAVLRVILWVMGIAGIISFAALLLMGKFIESLLCLLVGIGIGSLFAGGATLKDYASLIWWDKGDEP